MHPLMVRSDPHIYSKGPISSLQQCSLVDLLISVITVLAGRVIELSCEVYDRCLDLSTFTDDVAYHGTLFCMRHKN